MRIVLSGVETNNRGAELMLYAILQEIERKHPEAEVFISQRSVRQGLGYVHTPIHLRYKPWSKAKRIVEEKLHVPGILRRLRLPYLFLTDWNAVAHTDYYIDGSGFAFSDQWGANEDRIKRTAYTLRGYRKQGTRIIYLPQAFGPFEQVNTKRLVGVVFDNADVIMPREKVSMGYMQGLGFDNSKLRLFPDFTILVEGHCPERYAHLAGSVCVIPNARMIDKGVVTYDYYIQALTRIIEAVRQAGRSVYILSHETSSDNPLCAKLGESLKGSVEVVIGLDALEVKGLISTSYVCITSRFHGVASALNSCVPCLATSWSHKYAELFADYGQSDCVLDLKDMDASLARISAFLDPEANASIRKALSDELPRLKERTQEMWKVVWGE